jgi:hypothetical protein
MSQCQPAPRRLGSSSWLIPLAEFAHARASPLARGLRESKRRDVLAAFLSRAWYRPYHQELASGRNRDKAPPPPDDCTSYSASGLLRPSRVACPPRKARRAASSGGSPVFVWAWQQSRRPKWHTTPGAPGPHRSLAQRAVPGKASSPQSPHASSLPCVCLAQSGGRGPGRGSAGIVEQESCQLGPHRAVLDRWAGCGCAGVHTGAAAEARAALLGQGARELVSVAHGG